MRVLITAPHACDVRSSSHVCDIGAYSRAKLLQMCLENLDHDVITILNPTLHRDVLDVNRVEGRGLPYRQAIANVLSDMDLLVDVHSFPPSEPRFAGHQIVIFNFPTTFDDRFVQAVAHDLQRRGVAVLLYDGSPENDTVASALERGRMAMLVEFNENDASQAAPLVQWLAQAISNAGRETL